MKETSKETDNNIKDSIESSNNEIPINIINLANLKYENKYTPFKLNLNKVKQKNNGLKKYYNFYFYDNTSQNESENKNDKNNSKENENNIENNEINENKVSNVNTSSINKNDENINSSHNSNINNHPFINNLVDLMNVVKEDDENEYTESQDNREDYHSQTLSADTFGITKFTPRNDSCIKILVIDIEKTYISINPKYSYQKIEQKNEENEPLTKPSEGISNNGKDNENKDLIVFKEDEIKNPNKNTTYIAKELLGTGASGQVFKVFCPNDNNYYALKIIKNIENLVKKCFGEIKIISYLNQKDPNDQYHIIRLYDYFFFCGHLCLVIELLQKNIFQLLEMNHLEGISLHSIRFILKQLLQSVDFIHSMKVVHTDLKPENILLSVLKEGQNENSNVSILNNQNSQLDSNNNSKISNISLINRRVIVKIGDFGFACPLMRIDNELYIQSRFYRAPEAILHLKQKTEKVDVWSLGCILGELYLGIPIMPGNSSYDQLYKINTLIGEIPQDMIEKSFKRDVYFKKDNYTFNYTIKNPEEFYKEYPNVAKKEYEIPRNMKSIDDLINFKKDTIKSKNSLHKSMHDSSFSANSSNTKMDLVALIHLMKGMLQIDPRKRWSCKQCLKHPFLTKEKIDKFISFERNEISQLTSNSFSNKSNFQNNNCHSMIMNNSFNKFQANKGANINRNNTFYGRNFNSNNRNNFSFGNFINNNNNYMQNPYPYIFPNNANLNNNIYQNNFNNNIQGNNNYQNQRLNSSFSYNNNRINMMYYNNPSLFNFDPNRNVQNFYPYQNNNNFIQNNFRYNNQYFNNRNMPYNYNPYPNIRHNNTFMENSYEKLNISSNSNLSKNSKSKKKLGGNNQQFYKNKMNKNPKEFLFNKENIIVGNLEDNKQDIKIKDNINTQSSNDENNNENKDINPEIDKNGDMEDKKSEE
jgi:dual specificity protein kinase YAK1